MSADKLTIAPEIVDVSDTMRIASFKLLGWGFGYYLR